MGKARRNFSVTLNVVRASGRRTKRLGGGKRLAG